MVKGLNIFREYFKNYHDSYVIIGGTACDLIITEADLTPRATKDIDIILVVEALSAGFVKQFWQFINDGNYDLRQKSQEERKHYRFSLPQTPDFPVQVELFSRVPDLLDIKEASHLTPIPVSEDLSSLSAILMNDDYYHFTLKHSTPFDGMQRANTEALICLKAKAFLDLIGRKEKGEQISEKEIRKHKNDVFRMALMLTANDVFELPSSVIADMKIFADTVNADLPDKAIFKEMGAGNIDVPVLFEQFKINFKLND